ncbi:MAG: hypothetical protein H0X33_06885 [Taibaiella sp.]|nr:hypothetical protein [Taibaiella sp.]
MAARKRIAKKLPEFRLTKEHNEPEETDLKKVKAELLKEIEENEKNSQDWYDKELDKNLKQQK